MRPATRDVLTAWIIGVFALIAMCFALTGCGSIHPTAADEPVLYYKGPAVGSVTNDDRAWGEEAYQSIKKCVGWDGGDTPVKVVVHPGVFLCGSVTANGCQENSKLSVNVVYFRPALGHELIHYFHSRNGWAPDYNHTARHWKDCAAPLGYGVL